MSFLASIRQHGVVVTVDIGQTILEAALRQGVPYPHGCRSGNCGACKSRLQLGTIDLMPHSEFALNAAERRDGLILACRALPCSHVPLPRLDTDETLRHPLPH